MTQIKSGGLPRRYFITARNDGLNSGSLKPFHPLNLKKFRSKILIKERQAILVNAKFYHLLSNSHINCVFCANIENQLVVCKVSWV